MPIRQIPDRQFGLGKVRHQDRGAIIMTAGQNQDRAQPSALAGAKFAGTCPSGPWGNMCGYPRTQRQMLTIHLQFPGLWLLPSLASSPGPQIRRRRLTQVESNVHSGSISLARGCGTGHVARLAGLWLDRFLKKGSRWNNPVESSLCYSPWGCRVRHDFETEQQ